MTHEEIEKYIIKNYPDSCLAHNAVSLFRNSTLGFSTLKDCENFFYFEELNWCSCGDPESAKCVIRDYLRLVKERKDKDYYKCIDNFKEKFNCYHASDNPLVLCLAYTLDSAGFTEHGSSIDSCWLTEEGEMFLWLLNRNKDLDEVD